MVTNLTIMNFLRNAFLFVAAIVVTGCGQFAEIQADREKVLANVQSMCDAFVPAESMRKYDSGSVIKPEGGTYTITFLTSMECDDARNHFLQQLISQGWQSTPKNLGYYYKDNFVFGMTCRKRSSFHEENKIQVSCSWDEKGENKGLF